MFPWKSIQISLTKRKLGMSVADDQQTPGSYGYAAAKRKKLSYPYAVYIHRGTRDRQQLPRPIFNAFEKFLWDSRETIDAEENEKIKIEWLCHSKGIGIVICLDSFTAAFVKKLQPSVPQLKVRL